jgi:hypothetical protein
MDPRARGPKAEDSERITDNFTIKFSINLTKISVLPTVFNLMFNVFHESLPFVIRLKSEVSPPVMAFRIPEQKTEHVSLETLLITPGFYNTF